MSVYADKKKGKLTGRWAVEVMVQGRRLKGRFDTEREARSKEAEWKANPPAPSPSPQQSSPAEPTAAHHGGEVLYSFARAQAAGKAFLWAGLPSEQGSLDRLRIIQEVMGDRPLNALGDDFVEDLKDTLADDPPVGRGICGNTVNRYLATLSKFLNWVHKKKKWHTVPLPEITRLAVDGHRIRWFDLAEEARIYAATDDQGVVLTPAFAKLIRIAIRTGMRRGEILTVEPDQVRPGWVDLWKTKSGKPRAIPLMPEDEKDLRWLASGGNMPTKQQLRTRWARLRRAMKMEADEDFVFHVCRHTCATRMALGINASGRKVDPLTIQKWMGHADLKTTMRYVHMADDVLGDALELMHGEAA